MKSSDNSCNNLLLDVRPARWHAGYLPMLLAGMLLSIGLAGLGTGLRICLFTWVLVWTGLTWHRQSSSLKRLVWQGSGGWRLQDAGGNWCSARLLHAWSAGPAMSVLVWRNERGRKQVLLVTPGTAPEAGRRRLACHLRWRSLVSY